MQKAYIWVFMNNTFYTCLLYQNNFNVSFFLLEYKVIQYKRKNGSTGFLSQKRIAKYYAVFLFLHFIWC